MCENTKYNSCFHSTFNRNNYACSYLCWQVQNKHIHKCVYVKMNSSMCVFFLSFICFLSSHSKTFGGEAIQQRHDLALNQTNPCLQSLQMLSIITCMNQKWPKVLDQFLMAHRTQQILGLDLQQWCPALPTEMIQNQCLGFWAFIRT